MYSSETFGESQKDIKDNIKSLSRKKTRKIKPDFLKRNKKITLYLTQREKEEIENLTAETEAEQDLIKKLLNKIYNINLYIAS
jgi:hypothetical protein